MKFKENAIKPGMVIHCSTGEEYLSAVAQHENSTENTTGGETSTNTSTHPLDSPTEMSAVEVLEWLNAHYSDGVYEEVFGVDLPSAEFLVEEERGLSAQEVVDKITAYEAAKKAPKPVEVEWVDYYKFCPEDSPECTLQAMYLSKDVAEEEIKAYFEKYGDGYIVKHERRCRIRR